MFKIGDLVTWTADSEDKGSVGLVSWSYEWGFCVHWSDGEVVEYNYTHSHHRFVEVICVENSK